MRKYSSKSVMLFSILLGVSILLSIPGCKAWRTVSTSATYVQQNDSTKSTATITTKTVEEYQGVKKK